MKSHKTAAASPQDLVNDLHTLIAEAEKLIGDSVTEPSADIIDSLHTRYDAAQARLGEMYNGARTRVIAGAKSTDVVIRANPYQSIAIAAGVGLLLGVLLGRRTNS